MFHSVEPNRTEKNGTFFSRELKRMERTKHFFLENGEERKEWNILFQITEKNVTFFSNKQKRTEEWNLLFKRTDAQPC